MVSLENAKLNFCRILQIKKLGELGLLSINVNEKYGGSGQDTLALSVAVEEIAKGCGGTGTIVSVHNCLYVNLIDRCGTEEQKEKFLKPFTCGTLGCFALSEPGVTKTLLLYRKQNINH